MSDIITRRAFLSNMWMWGAGLMGAAGAWTSWDLLQPTDTGGFGGQIRGAPADEIPADDIIVIAGARAYLTRINDEITALYWKCTHLGCRVPWCETSGQFECPCHGSIYNRAGDYRAGPAPRGLDRFPVEIVDGLVLIDTSTIIEGPAPGGEVIDEPQRGPSCLEEA